MQSSVRKSIKNLIAKRLFGFGPAQDGSQVDQFQGPAKDIKLLGMYSGVAYKCISTLSEAQASQYEPYAFTTNAQGKETTIANHPFWAVLNDPNPDLTFYQLIEGSAAFVEQFGEFFWYLVPGALSGYKGGIKEIYLLRPDRMGIKLDKVTGEVIGYTYNPGVGNKHIPFQPEEIAHFMTFNPTNAYRGYAPLEAAIEYVVTEKEISRFTRNYFANNAQLSGIIEVTGKITRENWNKFVRQWKERYSGVDNAGKVAMIRDSQVKWTPITSDIQNMQLDELKKTTVEQIMMMFSIPKGLFGLENGEGLGRASVETLEYIFAKWTVNNKLKRLDDFIESICQDYYTAIKCQIGHENIIPSDKSFELEVYTAGVDKWLTRKEIRDKDPDLTNNLIDGSNELFVANTMLPIGDPMSSDKNVAAKTPVVASDNGPASGGDDIDGDDDNDSSDGDGADGKALKITLAKSKKKELAHEDKEQFRQQIERNYKQYVGKYREVLVKILESQKKTVLESVNHLTGKALQKGIADTLINMSDQADQINTDVTPILTELMLMQGQLAIEFSGDENAQYDITNALKQTIQARTDKMAANFDEETLNQLNDTLAEGIQNGDSIDDLSNRVEDVYSEAEGYRADRVAITEAQAASNGATLDAYQQNPVVIAMTWFANPGACEYCAELDGTTVGTEEVFVAQGDSVDVSQDDGSTDSYQADYGDVETPPLHPNCSCTIVPVTESG